MLRLALLLLLASTAQAQDVDLVYLGPGCRGSDNFSLNLGRALHEVVEESKATATLENVVPSTLIFSDWWIFPDRLSEPKPSTNEELLSLTTDFVAHADTATWALVDDHFPVLNSTLDVNFQWPAHEGHDWVADAFRRAQSTGEFLDGVLETVPLYRLTANGKTVLALPMSKHAAENPPPKLSSSLVDYERRIAVNSSISVHGTFTRTMFFGRTFGGNLRVQKALENFRESKRHGLFLHLGESSQDSIDCEALPDSEQPDAMLGTPLAFEPGRKRPRLISNVFFEQQSPKPEVPLKRYVLREVSGRTVLIVGFVGRDFAAMLPSRMRSAAKWQTPGDAWKSIQAEVKSQLKRAPDLVIALSSVPPKDTGSTNIDGLDVVIQTGAVSDLDEPTIRVTRSKDSFTRLRQRWLGPSLHATSMSGVLGQINVSFGPVDVDGRALPLDFKLEYRVPNESDSPSTTMRALFRQADERKWVEKGKTLVPDPTPYVLEHPALLELARGQNAYLAGRLVSDKVDSILLTDPLWMNLVLNQLRRGTGAEVAVMPLIARPGRIHGALAENFVEMWLPAVGAVKRANFSGAEMSDLLATIARHNRTHPRDEWVFVGGASEARGEVNGRAVRNEETYTVAVTDALLEVPAFENIRRNFEETEAQDAKALVLSQLQASSRKKTFFEDLAANPPEFVPHWTAGIEELAFNGTVFRNSANVTDFAAARETRVANPNLFAAGLKLNAWSLYDGATVAWESKLKAQYEGVLVDLVSLGLNQRLQEQRDDWVLSTELRLNRAKFSLGEDSVRLVPFINAAWDSEFTPTPNTSIPNGWYPWQCILRETLGVVAYPNSWVKEARLGFALQQDFSGFGAPTAQNDGKVHADFGLQVGLSLKIPLVWRLSLQDTLDFRYFFPDGDDRISDLSLRAQNVTKLMLEISRQIAIFVFVDLFGVVGKTPSNAQFGGNIISGLGLQFAGVLK